MSISGAIVPMATPIDERAGDVDEPALRRYTETLVEGGVHGLFPCGSVGEFPSLSDAQRRRVVETVVDAAGDVPVLAGCGDTSLDAVRDHVDTAAEVGADAAVVVTPYYLSTTQAGLVRFYRRVAEDAAVPVYLYNIPALTGHRLAVDTVRELAAVDGVVGIKDTSGDLTYHRDVVEATPDAFAVLQGATELAVASLDVGADGIVAGPANVFPGPLAALYDAHRRGDRDRAVGLCNDVAAPVVSATGDVPTAAAIKFLCSLAGVDVGGPLPPLPELSDEQREGLRRCYDAVADADAVRVPEA
jgi:4-hydroxy-tetrahydrodipicolinate synthase